MTPQIKTDIAPLGSCTCTPGEGCMSAHPGECLTATITELFPETWEEKIKRHAIQRKAMASVPVDERPRKWHQTWTYVNNTLAWLLEEVDA